MDKLIAICEYSNNTKVDVFVKETEDGFFKWYDYMGESTDDYDSVDEAREAFITFMESESPDTYVRRAN